VRFDKIHNLLGYAPQWTIEQGITQVVEALQTGKVQDYQDAKYSNVKFLSEEGLTRLARPQNGWAHELINQTTPEKIAIPPTLTSIKPLTSPATSSH
jgi:hypothetical protein